MGKTSLIHRFCQDKFQDNYQLTIGGNLFQKVVKLENGHIIKIHIWDTIGLEKFRSMTRLFYKYSSAALLVYDVSNSETLESLYYWVKELNENIDQTNFIISVAGNKYDLPDEKKIITFNDGLNFCKDQNITVFSEISAKTGVGVNQLFVSLAQKVYEAHRNEEE